MERSVHTVSMRNGPTWLTRGFMPWYHTRREATALASAGRRRLKALALFETEFRRVSWYVLPSRRYTNQHQVRQLELRDEHGFVIKRRHFVPPGYTP